MTTNFTAEAGTPRSRWEAVDEQLCVSGAATAPAAWARMIIDSLSRRRTRSSGIFRHGVTPCGVVIGMAVGVALCVGCAPEVINLRGEPVSKSRNVPFGLVARLENLQAPPDLSREREEYLERALAAALRNANVFKGVIYPASAWLETDLTVQGRVEETWPSAAGENFVTHFPGGIAFAPLWKGLRYPFEARATIQLNDSRTGREIRVYSATTSQLFVQKSANPAHFLGAVVIIPAVVRGLVIGHPNDTRREIIRRKAYADLWTDIARQIAEDKIEMEPQVRPPASTSAPDSVTGDTCQSRKGAVPIVGEDWEQYRSCQNNMFRLSGQVQLPEGVASVFKDDRADGILVYVVKGKIHSWTARGGSGSHP